MELTFIVKHLALLCFVEPVTWKSVETGAHLIENGIRVVEVGIDGPLQVLVMSLLPHQSDFDSKTSPRRTWRYCVALLSGAPVTAIKL